MPEKIITLYYFFDELLKAIAHNDDPQTRVSTAEVMTVATVAAECFTGNHQKSLDFLISHRYIPPFPRAASIAAVGNEDSADCVASRRRSGSSPCLCYLG